MAVLEPMIDIESRPVPTRMIPDLFIPVLDNSMGYDELLISPLLVFAAITKLSDFGMSNCTEP